MLRLDFAWEANARHNDATKDVGSSQNMGVTTKGSSYRASITATSLSCNRAIRTLRTVSY